MQDFDPPNSSKVRWESYASPELFPTEKSLGLNSQQPAFPKYSPINRQSSTSSSMRSSETFVSVSKDRIPDVPIDLLPAV